MWQYACQGLTCTAYGKVEEGKGKQKKGQPSALVLKGENDRKKANALRAFWSVSCERAKTVVERERKKGP